MCEHENIKRHNIYEEGYLVEYVETCEHCNIIIGVWSYGVYENYIKELGEQ